MLIGIASRRDLGAGFACGVVEGVDSCCCGGGVLVVALWVHSRVGCEVLWDGVGW